MSAIKKWIFCVAAILALCSGVAKADELDDAFAAYNNGDYAVAVGLLRPIAERGDALAQYNLGAIYANGHGVTRDYQEAAKWWRLAAAQGNADAQFYLSLIYAKGQDVTQDYREAVKWSRLAAAQGHALAQYNLGAIYANGHGVTRDYQEAAKWWRLAAAQGNADAQSNLDTLAKEQGGRDLLAQPAPWLLDPTESDANNSQSQTTPRHGSYLDRFAMGGIGGAVLGAILGLFILVRAVVNKFKAPAATGAMEIYRDRPQAIKIGAALLFGCAAFLVYFLFIKTNTVDYYLNNYQERIEKIQECGQVPDITKDRECMNAYTAQRMFMLR